MLAASITALQVLYLYVNPWVGILSTVLMLVHRKHDVVNTMSIAAIYLLYHLYATK